MTLFGYFISLFRGRNLIDRLALSSVIGASVYLLLDSFLVMPFLLPSISILFLFAWHFHLTAQLRVRQHFNRRLRKKIRTKVNRAEKLQKENQHIEQEWTQQVSLGKIHQKEKENAEILRLVNQLLLPRFHTESLSPLAHSPHVVQTMTLATPQYALSDEEEMIMTARKIQQDTVSVLSTECLTLSSESFKTHFPSHFSRITDFKFPIQLLCSN